MKLGKVRLWLHRRKITWKKWVYDFLHGRTHSSYGCLLIFFLNFFLLLKYGTVLDIRIASSLSMTFAAGVFVDIAAHLWVH